MGKILHIGIIPAASISAVLLVSLGGFYVWHEISTPPRMQTPPRQNELATTPAIPTLAKAPVAAPILPSTETVAVPDVQHKANARHTKSGLVMLKVSALMPAASAVNAEDLSLAVAGQAQTIHIDHSQLHDAVAPILLRAWQAYRNGDYDTAAQSYGEVLNTDLQNRSMPNRDALLGMAAIAQQRSQDAVAVQFYNQLLAIDPHDSAANAGISSLSGNAEATGVESGLKLLLEQSPEAASLHFALGNQYARQSLWGKAEQAYFSASELESDNAQYAFNLAVSLDHLAQGKLAALHYRRALQLDSANHSFDHAQTQLRLDELTKQR